MRCHVKIPGGKKMLNKLDGSTIRIAFSVGYHASAFGTDAEYLENVINRIINLKTEDCLFIAWELQQFNCDQFIVSLDTVSKDPINRCNVLSDNELIEVFKQFESDPLLNLIHDDKEIGVDLAAELFAKMFEPVAKKEGERVTNYLTPVWNKRKSKTGRTETMHTDVLSLGDVIKIQSEVKDWDKNGKPHNRYKEMLSTIQQEYDTQTLERSEFDSTIQDVFNKRKFVEAGKRLKSIFMNPENSAIFKNKAMITFINAIMNYLDFEAIGKKEIRMYLFTELAQMRSEPSKTFIFYPNKPHKGLQNYYERHKIPLITTPMYPMMSKEKPKVVPIKEQKNITIKKSNETSPKNVTSISPVILFSKKTEKTQSREEKYSCIDGTIVEKQKTPDKLIPNDCKLESLEEKSQEPKSTSSPHLKSRHHDLPSLNIPGTFYRPPELTPTTAKEVGQVRIELALLMIIFERVQSEGLPLEVAVDKLENILEKAKLLKSNMSQSLPQQDSVIYSKIFAQ